MNDDIFRYMVHAGIKLGLGLVDVWNVKLLFSGSDVGCEDVNSLVRLEEAGWLCSLVWHHTSVHPVCLSQCQVSTVM